MVRLGSDMQFLLIAICTFCTLIPLSANGARILGIFHFPSRSHHILGSTLLKALAQKGHEVTMLSPYPLENPPQNYRDIPLPELHEYNKDFDHIKMLQNTNMWTKNYVFYNKLKVASNVTLHSENVQKLINDPTQHFDLVIMECFMNDALMGIAHHFKAPVISMSTSGSFPINTYLTDNPTPYAYIPNIGLAYPEKMTFMQRVINTVISLLSDAMVMYVMPNHQDEYLRQVFPDAPHAKELAKNVSLVLLNSHFSIETPRPYVPQMVPIGGFHVQEPKKLPKDLQDFMDKSPEGVIFFSLGSNLKSSNLPKEKLQAILSALGNMKQKVLFKWETEELENQPKNVKIGKWLPQNDILAHKNTIGFVTHGGLLSTIEAVYHGVPLVGIPFFGDQQSNMEIASNDGYAIQLLLEDLNEETLSAALNEIINNPQYKQVIQKKSVLLREQPIKPLDKAVFWVEHVLKHKGGNHLRTAAQHLSWPEILLLDVIAVLITGVALVATLFCLICKLIFCICKCALRCMFGCKKVCNADKMKSKCCVSKCIFSTFFCKKNNVSTVSETQQKKKKIKKETKKQV